MPKLGTAPCSRRLTTSYRPIAMKGPMSRQPETIDIVYSGLKRNTAVSVAAMAQKHRP